MASTGSAVRPEDVREWGQQLDEVARRIGARFPRSETRDRVRAYRPGSSARCSGRTAGRSPSRSATPTPTASST